MARHDRQLDQQDKRRAASAARSDRVAFDKHRFVKLDLSSDQKADFQGYMGTGEFDHVEVDYFVNQGYSVKFSQQDNGQTRQCSVTCSDSKHQNSGLVLTGRGSSSTIALAVCYYKDVYLCEDGIWATGEANQASLGLDVS